MDEPVEKTPSIGISYQIQTRQSRQLVLQSFIDRDCEPAALNALLDKMRVAGDRQLAWEKIDDTKLAIKQEYLNAEQQRVAIEKEDSVIKNEWDRGNRKGDVRLTTHQLQKQREAYQTAENIKLRIANLNEALAEFEARVAG
jgi:hypothetical protein